MLSPDQMWYGKTPPVRLYPFLKPAFCYARRTSKDSPRAIRCFYLGPAPYHPSDTLRLMTAGTRQIINSRDVTWKTLGVANEFQPVNASPEVNNLGGITSAAREVSGEAEQDEQPPERTTIITLHGPAPTNRNIGPADGNIGPMNRNIGPANGNIGSTNGNIGSTNEDKGPTTDQDQDNAAEDHHEPGPTSEAIIGQDAAQSSNSRNSEVGRVAPSPPPEPPNHDPNTEGATDCTSNNGNQQDNSSIGDQDVSNPVGDLRDNSSIGDQDVSTSAGDLRDDTLTGNPGSVFGRAEPQHTTVGEHNTAATTAQRQLQTYLPDPPGQETLQLGRTRAQTRTLHGMGLLSEDSPASTGPSPSTARGQLDRHLRESTGWYIGLMATGQGDPISLPLADVEPAPTSYGQAMKSIHKELWLQAMTAEYDGLKENKTFEYVATPKDRKPVDSRWVFRWKVNAEGEVVRAKARLVAKGFSQVPGQDFDEVFSPTPQSPSVRLVLAIAVQHDLDLFHFDAQQAFIQSDLKEEVYMRLPPGCGNASGSTVRLRRSLYGLRQASRSWNSLLVSTLQKYGFEQCAADPCVFRLMRQNQVVMIMSVHVDDVVVAGKEKDCNDLCKFLNGTFPMSNLDELTHYIGCAFTRDRKKGTLKVTQTACINKLTDRFSITHSSPTPACQTVHLMSRRDGEERCTEPYREAVGGLMWLANTTRPDIASAVRTVACFAQDPSTQHWKAVLRILQYLKGTRELGLTFTRHGRDEIAAFADATYADKKESRKSVSGGVMMFGGVAVSWFSRTQRCVATSSSEAEYISLAETAKEVVAVGQVLDFLRPGREYSPAVIFEDNVGALQLAQNPLSSKRTKHIDVRFHFIRDLVKRGKVIVEHVDTTRQRADFLTKPLAADKFSEHRDVLLNVV